MGNEIVEKIIDLRKQYKITQRELTEDIFSRSYLTMLEKGKKKINKKTAKVLIDRFNEIFSKRGIDRIITYNWLSSKSYDDSLEIVNNYRFRLNNIKDEHDLLKIYHEVKNDQNITLKTKEEIELYYEISNQLYKYNYILQATLFSNSLFGPLFFHKDYEKLGKCLYISLNVLNIYQNYSSIIFFYNQYKQIIRNFDLKQQKKIYFILLNTYIITKDYETSNYILNILKNFNLSSEQRFDLFIQEIKLLKANKNYEKAINICKNFEITNHLQNYYLIFYLMELYLLAGLTDNAVYYAKKAKHLLSDLEYIYVNKEHYFFCQSYYHLGEFFKTIKDNKKACHYFEQIIDLKDSHFKIGDNHEKIFKTISFLLDNLERLEKVRLDDIADFYKRVLPYAGNDKLAFKISKKYYEQGATEKMQRFLSDILND